MMRDRLKGLVRSGADRAWRALLSSPWVRRRISALGNGYHQELQLLLKLKYRDLLATRGPLPTFDDVEFRCYSQNGEDGILLFLFSVVGTTNKVAVEIGAGDGIECNAANLLLNHGWTGLLIDADRRRVDEGRAFYAGSPDAWTFPPRFVRSRVTPANVNDLLKSSAVTGSIDLLSLDIDGMEYWIWEALEAISPRVVVVEYQTSLGPTMSVTAAYREDHRPDPTFSNCGASLAAFVKLAGRKGYRLIGAQRYGFNAFFLRNDVAPEHFPAVAAGSCLLHPKAQETIKRRGGLSPDDWVDV